MWLYVRLWIVMLWASHIIDALPQAKNVIVVVYKISHDIDVLP